MPIAGIIGVSGNILYNKSATIDIGWVVSYKNNIFKEWSGISPVNNIASNVYSLWVL